MGSDSFSDEELTVVELDATPEQAMIINIVINEGRRREREEIIAELMKHYNESCCCDTAVFGEHYLSHRQPDNFIDMIRNRPYEH